MKMKNVNKKVKNLVLIAREADLKKVAVPFYDILPSWCFPKHNLRFKAYCVGMARTGTTSIHTIFSRQYRSAHESEERFVVYKLLASANGKIDKSKLIKYVKHRDRRLGLEMDSSHLNGDLVDILVSEFSQAKFILTIRNCYSWVDSFLDLSLGGHPPLPSRRNTFRGHLPKLYDLRFKANQFKYAKEEKILADKGLYTLDGYFSYWNEYNNKILTIVPKERLLVVKTREINHSIHRIENFLGIKLGSLSINIHENLRRRKFHILSQIDKDFLEEKANLHCQKLMDKYFPEVKGFDL